MTYRTFDQLNGKTLEYGDAVVLIGHRHETYDRFLDNTKNMNGWIFDEHKIHGHYFLKEVYGYEPTIGDWPECRTSNYEALTRAALVLLAFQEGYDVEVKMPNNEWKMFSKEYFVSRVYKPSFRIANKKPIVTPEEVHVGCQTITFNIVEKLYETMVELRRKSKK
jgi:hypothetical protein